MRISAIRTVFILAFTATACQSADQAPGDPAPGERITTITANADTTRETGVVSWEIYRDLSTTTVIGLDGKGQRAFRQQMTESIVAGKKTIEVTVSEPTARSFRYSEGGERVDLVGSDDPKLAKLVSHLEVDVKDPTNTEYGMCASAVTSGVTCVASTAGCTTCPVSGIGCFACPVMLVSCWNTGYFSACCYLYGNVSDCS